MFRAHLKLIAAFLVLGIVAAAVVGMYHAWTNYLEPSYQARQEILDLEKLPPKRIDVGAREFQEAMDQMQRGEVAAAHAQLSELVRTYEDSSAYSKSRRILGEVNMDRLLSNVRTPGKIDYVVKGGDSLNRIASQQKTTVDYIMFVNDLQGLTLQKGASLLVGELEFSVNVSLDDKKLTLLRDEKFFKQYPIRVSRNIRPADTKIESRTAFAKNRSVRIDQADYVGSEKWLNCGKGITLGPFTPETRDDSDLRGIFLDVADIEELYTVLRNGMPVRVRK
ncbi:MAG: hypothetical protein ACI8XO_004737 [Verrucomicrobiales bacterium]|jgi:hypothetical protein